LPKNKAIQPAQKGKAPRRRSRVQKDFPPLTIDLFRLLNEIPLGIALIDSQGRLMFMNHIMEGIVGLSLDEARELPCHQVIRSRICFEACPISGLRTNTESLCMESDLLNRDRKRVPVRITLGPVYNNRKTPSCYIETVEDLRPLKELDETLSSAYQFKNIIGKSPQMEKLFQILPVIAQSDSSVLLTGETGTGKDLLAEAIHQASSRAKGPFVKVNCGALPETLLESELFGHKKGAFTGAVKDKIGRFHLAHHGTLYLTEIGDLPLPLQVKLLTFLDDRTVFPLGSTKAFVADVRIIAATHRDLKDMVQKGLFREDLFFRLNVLRLRIPPLRERQGDIRLLLEHFLDTFTTKFNSRIRGFSARSLNLLTRYPYPGNVRELKNIVEYAVNICREGLIYPRHLPAYLTEPQSFSPTDTEEKKTFEDTKPGEEIPTAPVGTWRDMERRLIADALLKAQGNRTRAARMLGWGRSTLWRKIKAHGLDG